MSGVEYFRIRIFPVTMKEESVQQSLENKNSRLLVSPVYSLTMITSDHLGLSDKGRIVDVDVERLQAAL